MKRFNIILILCLLNITAKAELNEYIEPNEVDSIIIKTIDWSVVAFGPYGYSRNAFDQIYDSLFYNDIESDLLYIKIEDNISTTLFCSILNYSLEPYKAENIKAYPNDILQKSPQYFPNMGIMNYEDRQLCNEQLEIRGKIKIHKKNGVIIDAYISRTSIDIFNYRYKSFILSSFISSYIRCF